MLVVPFGRRRILGLVVDLAGESELPPERLVEPVATLEAGVPDELVELGLVDRRCLLLDARRAGWRSCCLPGPARARGPRRAPRPASCSRRASRVAGREALQGHGGPAGSGRASTPRSGRLAQGPSTAAELEIPHAHAREPRAPRPGADRAPGGGAQAGRRRAGRGGDRRRDRSGHRLTQRPGRRARRGARAARCAPPRRAAPSRRDGQRQDGGVPARRAGGARAGAHGDRDGAGDRAHAPDRAPLRGALRRPRRDPALQARARRALRRVAAAAQRRGPHLRGAALGRVRAARGPGPGGPRRGARLRLQAGERPALRRPRGGGAASAHGRAPCCCAGRATPRPESWLRMPRLSLPERVDDTPLAAGRAARHARAAARAAPGCAARARAGAGARQQGDRARRPPRLVAVRRLPRLRAGVDVPQL